MTSGSTTFRPPDVEANGCLFCGGPPLFVHGYPGVVDGRICDACGTAWSAEHVAYMLGALLAGRLGGDHGVSEA